MDVCGELLKRIIPEDKNKKIKKALNKSFLYLLISQTCLVRSRTIVYYCLVYFYYKKKLYILLM